MCGEGKIVRGRREPADLHFSDTHSHSALLRQPRSGRCNPAVVGVVGVLVASKELVSDRVRPRAGDAPPRAGERSTAEISVKEVSDRVEARRTASRVPWDCSDPISSLTVHAFPFHIGGVPMSSL